MDQRRVRVRVVKPSKRILVVDDDASIRDLVFLALTDEGYEVVLADDGAAALRLVEGSPPDLILLDMRMAELGGEEFVRLYRALPGPHAPVVLFTAARDAEQSAAEIPVDALLPKPFDLDDLLSLVQRLTTAPRPRA